MTSVPYDISQHPFYEFVLPDGEEDAAPVPLVAVPPPAPAKPAETMVDGFFEALQLFHGLDDLLDRKTIDRLLDRLVPSALELCPAESRDELRKRLATIRPQKTIEAPPSAEQSDDEDHKRFALILGHLSQRIGRRAAHTDLMAISQLIAIAANAARTRDELKDLLRRIPAAPGHETENIFQLLAHGIASWDVEEAGTAMPEATRAMAKVMALSKDGTERATRFRELMFAAADRLNEGAFAAALSMLELSERVLGQGALDSNVTERIRIDALRLIEEGRFQHFLSDSTKHEVLRKVLRFFPSMQVPALVDQFCDQQDRERRVVLGHLLVVWGAFARRDILQRLDETSSPSGECIHDLYALLTRIPGSVGNDVQKELEILERASAAGGPFEFVLRAIAALGNLKTNEAATLLIRRLADFESLPFRSDKSFYTVEEVHQLLDAAVAALAHTGTKQALRSIVRHCLADRPGLGDLRSRLRHLAGVDLSIDLDTVAILWKQINEDLPTKMLARSVTVRPAAQPTLLIKALAATENNSTKRLLYEVAQNYAQFECGKAAAHVIEQQRRRTIDAKRANKSGNLVYYALPSLIRSSMESQATGLLSLASQDQEIRGRIWLKSGTVVHVECGKLQGAAALYELLERPVTGSFAFSERPLPPSLIATEPLPIASMLKEGMRRHEELQRIAAIVPDDVMLVASDVRPSCDPV